MFLFFHESQSKRKVSFDGKVEDLVASSENCKVNVLNISV